jgi:hypothetical protein
MQALSFLGAQSDLNLLRLLVSHAEHPLVAGNLTCRTHGFGWVVRQFDGRSPVG